MFREWIIRIYISGIVRNEQKVRQLMLDRIKLHRYNDKACVISLRVLLKSEKSGNTIIITGGEKHANI